MRSFSDGSAKLFAKLSFCAHKMVKRAKNGHICHLIEKFEHIFNYLSNTVDIRVYLLYAKQVFRM